MVRYMVFRHKLCALGLCLISILCRNLKYLEYLSTHTYKPKTIPPQKNIEILKRFDFGILDNMNWIDTALVQSTATNNIGQD